MTIGKMRGEYVEPEGLFFTTDFITEKEEKMLMEFISTIAFDEVKIFDQVAKRVAKNYGYDYEFSERNVSLTDPIPMEFFWLKERAAKVANLNPEEIVECLVTKYPTGATMGWHRDAFVFGSKIIGISLGSTCIMRFQRKEGTKRLVYELELSPRSLYIMSGPARYKWQHSIPPTKDTRYSITFRTLRKTKK